MIVESDKYWQYVCLSVSLCLPHSDSVSVSLPLTHCPSLCLTNCHTSPMNVPRYLPTYLSIYLPTLSYVWPVRLSGTALRQAINQSSKQSINLHHSTDCTSIILIILMLMINWQYIINSSSSSLSLSLRLQTVCIKLPVWTSMYAIVDCKSVDLNVDCTNVDSLSYL